MKNWFLPIIILILGLFSILTLSSIAPALAPRQLIFFIVGFGLFFSVAKINFKRILSLSPLFFIFTLILLVVVLLLAPITRGTSRWISIGSLFAVQPSQLAIPAVALFTINLFEKKSFEKISNLIWFAAVVAIPALLILTEPDLGTTLVYLASLSSVVFISKIKLKHLLPILLVGALITILSWSMILKPYQKERITSFISPDDFQGSGYNARQSLIAVGSGKLVGKGLGQGIQSHLRFLPERQTDFVFASFAEEFGYIGSMVMLLLYFAIVYALFSTALNSSQESEKRFLFVTISMLTIQVVINIGMNIGLLPITGITLPFMSYGGSSILTLMGMLGINQSILINQKKEVVFHLS